MNIVFWFLVVVVLALLWFGLCSLYKPIGSFLFNIFDSAKNELTNDEKENKKNEED